MDFDWEKGRQLVNAESDDHEIEYTYDMAGIRDSKTVDGVTYNYLTLDGKVVRQTWGSNVLDIIYDNSGLPYAFKYNGAYYIYVLNQQGDVIRIVNGTGATVAEYKYDAWGNLLVAESSLTAIGKINPIRYRGYYYDTETGFYYLQSRYYDPEIGRFISADSSELIDGHNSFLANNLFAYCFNTPVNMSDHDGMFGQLALAGGQAISVGAGFSLSAITAGLASITPIGWIAIGVAVVVPVVVCVGASIYNASRGHEESSSKANDDPDPYARPNQKKQGRERKSKARTHPSWKPRTNPKPPKKHTPGRDHRKFIWILWMFGELINGIADWMLQ